MLNNFNLKMNSERFGSPYYFVQQYLVQIAIIMWICFSKSLELKPGLWDCRHSQLCKPQNCRQPLVGWRRYCIIRRWQESPDFNQDRAKNVHNSIVPIFADKGQGFET